MIMTFIDYLITMVMNLLNGMGQMTLVDGVDLTTFILLSIFIGLTITFLVRLSK